jgi:hypothetical protein
MHEAHLEELSAIFDQEKEKVLRHVQEEYSWIEKSFIQVVSGGVVNDVVE